MKYIFCILIIASAVSSAAAEEGLSLKTAIDTALSNNNELKAAGHQKKAAEEDLASSEGSYYPRIDVEGKYTRLNDPITLDMNDIRTAIISADYLTSYILSGYSAAEAVKDRLESQLPSFTLNLQDRDYYNLTLSATQILYAGGRIRANVKAKKAALETAGINETAEKEKIIAGVVGSYFLVELAQQTQNIKEEVLTGMREHDSTAEKLFRTGMISKANRMRAESALADADREAKKAARDTELAEIVLENLLNSKIDSYKLTTDFFIPGEISGEEYFIDKAVNANPALRNLAKTAEQLEAKEKADKGNLLPTLAAFGKYEAYKADLTALEPEWAAGLVLKIPVFSGLSDYRNIKKTEAQREALRNITDNARELIRTQVKKYRHDMLSAAEEYASLESSLELAEENLRLNKISFEQGVATSLEVIDAQLNLGKVKTERCKALYDYAYALSGLLRTCGESHKIFDYR